MSSGGFNPRLYEWDRFQEIARDFHATFDDHPTRVKTKAALQSFEDRNGIEEWEWRVIDSLRDDVSDYLPPPTSRECLEVYLTLFEGHPEHAALVLMAEHRTPLDRMNRWMGDRRLWDMSPMEIQRQNQRFEVSHVECKRSARAWLKRWKCKVMPWLSRNRSSVCKALRVQLLKRPVASDPMRPSVREWLRSLSVVDTACDVETSIFEAHGGT